MKEKELCQLPNIQEIKEVYKTNNDLLIPVIHYAINIAKYFAMTMRLTEEQAISIAHDSCMALFEKSLSDEDFIETNICSYLRGIIHHKSVDVVRKTIRENENKKELEKKSIQNTPTTQIDDYFAKYDTELVIRQVLGLLQEECQEILYKRIIIGEDYKNLADTLNKSVDAVRMQYSRCLKKLRELLSDNDDLSKYLKDL